VEFSGFNWDDGNREKCGKHGVSTETIESLFRQPVAIAPDPLHSGYEERFKAIGRSKEGRFVMVVFTMRSVDGGVQVRPVSARYMHRKEVENYERHFKA
jgi:uncharacterized DUF497 family protein